MRRKRPEWSEVVVMMPKRRRGFYCHDWLFRDHPAHYVNHGQVWACDQCRATYVCNDRWEQHKLEHAIHQLARNNT
jgi:hypothetical protein